MRLGPLLMIVFVLAGCGDGGREPCVGSACEDARSSMDGGPRLDGGPPPDMGPVPDAALDGMAADDAFVVGPSPDAGPVTLELEGYGTDSTFGEGGDTCVVTTLDDSGPGSLRACVVDRVGPVSSPMPRVITFAVGGTITLLTDLAIRQPFLTIDGTTAPAPGITIAKVGNGEAGETIINTWSREGTCGHDVLVRGLRLRGVWTRDTTDHSQNAGLLSVDGEDLPGCLHHVVIWGNVYVDGQDSAGTIWGSVTDLTFAYNLLLYDYHPQSISHFPGGDAGQQRERISIHHNVYAYCTERTPNIRGDTWDIDITQNVMHQWASLGLGSMSALHFRCRGGGCPLRANLVGNHFTSASPEPTGAVIFSDMADPSQVYSEGNRFPPEETDDGTASAAFPRPAHAAVTVFEHRDLATRLLPAVGLAVRTAEEQSVLDEIAARLATESP